MILEQAIRGKVARDGCERFGLEIEQQGGFFLFTKIRLTRKDVKDIVILTEVIIWVKLQECKLKRS